MLLERPRTWLIILFCSSIFGGTARAQDESRERDVVVDAESDGAEHNQFTEMGEYGQPAWAERNRASSTTSVYVLSPYEAFFGVNWEGDFARHGKSSHDLTQEVDVGLPHRFEFGLENEVGIIQGGGHETSLTLEARYAFAIWNAIPLNPAVSLEYKFGLGRAVQSVKARPQPDAVSLRILLGQALFENKVGYGLNLSFQQEVESGNGREVQVSQSIGYGLDKGRFEVGADMRYTHSTSESAHGRADELLLGPTLGWKPTRQTRITIAPLLGCTSQSPAVSAFVLFSYEFGGAEAVMPAATVEH